MNHYVYRIDRPSKGQWYVGIRTCRCWPTEDSYMGSGTRVRRIPRDQLAKTILVIVENREEACRIEAALVGPEQVADPLCLNLCEGGDSGPIGWRPSEETRRKIALGWTEERKAKMAEYSRNREVSLESRAKMSSFHQGRKASTETRAKMSEAQKGNTKRVGFKSSEETKQKHRENMRGNQNLKGHVHSEEAKAKQSAKSKAWWVSPAGQIAKQKLIERNKS